MSKTIRYNDDLKISLKDYSRERKLREQQRKTTQRMREFER